jgi:16S rRNA (cytosine967-C5)-methyltransferase
MSRRATASHDRARQPAGSRKFPRRRPDATRQVAYDVLRAVDERAAYANLLLPALLRERGLGGRDAAFATELTYGTLRGVGTYDAVVEACVDRPLAHVDSPVLDVLRLGAHQLLAMRVPAHAAVSATVDLARGRLGPGRSAFVNAVLRRVATRDLKDWLAELAPPLSQDPVGHLALVHAHPRWVVTAVADVLGGDLDEAARALAADNVPAPLTLVARPGRSSRQELVAEGAQAGRWSPYAAVLPTGNPSELTAVREARAGVQDEGSQLVALAVARATVDGRDRRWLDLCAGPGGKTALLEGLAAERGAVILAVDRQPHRARLVHQAIAGTAAAVVVADGTQPPAGPGTFDRVLVDAPCTGLGALRRRPEARWRRTPRDVEALGPLQRALLLAAVDLTRIGGIVGYATCSPHPAETRAVVQDVLAARPDVALLDARPSFPGLPELGRGPDVQLWPHRHGTDAMYFALLCKSTPSSTGGS